MRKYFVCITLITLAVGCKSSKSDVSEFDSTIEITDDSSYVENYDETLYQDGEFSVEDYMMEDETPTRGIYNPSRTLLTDLVHTKLEVSFNWEKSQLNGKASITAKHHFHPSDSLILDAKGMDIKKVELAGKKLDFSYEDSLQLRIKLDKKYTRDEKFTVVIDYTSKPEERQTSGSEAITSDKGLYFINPKKEANGNMPQIWTQGETEASSVWFPTIDSPNSKSTQEMYITVEDKYLTLSNGKLISSKKIQTERAQIIGNKIYRMRLTFLCWLLGSLKL